MFDAQTTVVARGNPNPVSLLRQTFSCNAHCTWPNLPLGTPHSFQGISLPVPLVTIIICQWPYLSWAAWMQEHFSSSWNWHGAWEQQCSHTTCWVSYSHDSLATCSAEWILCKLVAILLGPCMGTTQTGMLCSGVHHKTLSGQSGMLYGGVVIALWVFASSVSVCIAVMA